jgi:predicted DCC family thiol-disulfide oxidoreductase YuxK
MRDNAMTAETAKAPETSVLFDGACPLCRAEISHYQRQEGAAGLCFIDVSKPDAALPEGMTREAAMARFHVVEGGRIVSGAAAFVAVWAALPRWRWVARLAAWPPVLAMLEASYRLFLPVRPALSWLAGRLWGNGR